MAAVGRTPTTPVSEAATMGLILLMVVSTLGLGYAVSGLLVAFGARENLGLTIPGRLVGVGFIAVGASFILWTSRHRPPREMLASTSVTLSKLIRRVPIEDFGGREEPFVVTGPHRFVRNPLYFGVIAVSFGLGLAFSSLALVLWGVVVSTWFWFFLIPFEERELAALFGESYAQYKKQVPKLFPYGRRYRPARRLK